MISPDKIQYDKKLFSEIEIEPTEDEQRQIESKKLIFIKNKKLVFEDNPEQQKEKYAEDYRQEILGAKNLNKLQQILIKYLPKTNFQQTE